MSKKQAPKSLTVYGTETEIEQYGQRLRHVLPGGENLSAVSAVRAADYGRAIDANIFRGEIYAYEQGGKLTIVEGYKLLVRWARRQSDFFDSAEEMTREELEAEGCDPDEDIGWKVSVLREDKLGALAKLAEIMRACGVPEPYAQARAEIGQVGTGIITKKDRTTKKGEAKDPPVGWTWDDVAKKRALKNALNLAYGVPSPREIADESWRVGDVVTTEEDWQEAYNGERDYTPEEQALLAAAAALERERKAQFDALSPDEQQAKVEENCRAMGQPDPDFEGYDPGPEPPPLTDEEIAEPEPEPEPIERPPVSRDSLTPEVIRRTCRYKARWKKGLQADWSDAERPDPPPSDPIDAHTIKLVGALLNKALASQENRDEKRHAVYLYLFGVDSATKLTIKEGQSIVSWISLAEPATFGDVKGLAFAEVAAVVAAWQEEQGQLKLDLE